MSPLYLTDEEIISAAFIVPSDMMFKSERSKQLTQKVLTLGVKTCVVVWLDDTMAFIAFDAELKMPPAAHIISEYRKFHNLPAEMQEKRGAHES